MRSTDLNTFGSMFRSLLQILLTCHAPRRPRLVPPEPGPKVNSVNLNATGPTQSASWRWESIQRKSFRPLQNTDRTSGIQRPMRNARWKKHWQKSRRVLPRRREIQWTAEAEPESI